MILLIGFSEQKLKSLNSDSASLMSSATLSLVDTTLSVQQSPHQEKPFPTWHECRALS